MNYDVTMQARLAFFAPASPELQKKADVTMNYDELRCYNAG